ncbi:MAG: hypothetical protein J6P03_04445, partial [Opitutales bacterium]|nr:hypothetical protein [Opitutales bacterium]
MRKAFKDALIKAAMFALIFFAANSLLANADDAMVARYPTALSEYDDPQGGVFQILASRARHDPFNLYASIIFALAIIHTFASSYFNKIGNRFERKHLNKLKVLEAEGRLRGAIVPVSFRATLFHFLGEVEAVFGIWLIPLFAGMVFMGGWDSMTSYVDYLAFVDKKFTEPMFVVVIMCIAATKPIIVFAGKILNAMARAGGATPAAWWVSILVFGPLLGSFITEPAAITICAMLLSEKFYKYKPSAALRYATLGLLLVAVSAGGTLTHFAAPPVLMVAAKWDWSTPFMLEHFGWKAVLGIFISIIAYFFIFRGEFARLNSAAKKTDISEKEDVFVPKSVIAVHIFFLAFTVFVLHHSALVIFSFLFFIAYIMATRHYQYELNIKTPILVGFFLASLVTHGTLQSWWIEPILGSLGDLPLFLGSLVLTSVNDNAAITYLGTLVPDFSETKQYLLV